MPEKVIVSRDNPRIKTTKRLQQRRERIARGALLLEGVRLVADAWAAGVRPLSVFYDPDALKDGSPGAALLYTMVQADVEAWACTTPVFAELSETVTPQGLAAVVPLPNLPLPAAPTLALVLDGVRDPGNVGTLLRSAEAVGVEIVLFGPGTVDAFNGKVVRAAMGAHMRLPLRELPSWEALRALLPPTMPLYVAEMEATLTYDAVAWRSPAGLIVGGEAEGASAAARAAATAIRIPMRAPVESLNAAMAGTIVLFEAARQRNSQA
jgi:TrmH family RNA methyltransferase